MKCGLESRTKSKKTLAVQQRIDTLYARHKNGDITRNELSEGLSFVVAKNIKSKHKNKRRFMLNKINVHSFRYSIFAILSFDIFSSIFFSFALLPFDVYFSTFFSTFPFSTFFLSSFFHPFYSTREVKLLAYLF